MRLSSAKSFGQQPLSRSYGRLSASFAASLSSLKGNDEIGPQRSRQLSFMTVGLPQNGTRGRGGGLVAYDLAAAGIADVGSEAFPLPSGQTIPTPALFAIPFRPLARF